MKKLLLFAGILAGLSFVPSDNGISKKEKKSAVKFLKTGEKDVLNSLKGLSAAQLNFKPGPDRWSVEDCMKHIAATEMALWQMTEAGIKAAPNPEKRAEIKMTDEEVKANIASREKKVKTMPPMEPQNTSFKSLDEAVASFTENRGKLIEYVKSTEEDLRNHVAILPFGNFDSYQMILFIGAHSNRHLAQIEEVKADPGFPKE